MYQKGIKKDTKRRIAHLMIMLESQTVGRVNITNYGIRDTTVSDLLSVLGDVLVGLEDNSISIQQAKEKEQYVFNIILQHWRTNYLQ